MATFDQRKDLLQTVVLDSRRFEGGHFRRTAAEQLLNEHLPGWPAQSICICRPLVFRLWHGNALERLGERRSYLGFEPALWAKEEKA